MDTADRISKDNVRGPELCCVNGDFRGVTAYLDHALSPREAEEFHGHLQTCDVCRRLVDASVLSTSATDRIRAGNEAMMRQVSPESVMHSKERLLSALRREYTSEDTPVRESGHVVRGRRMVLARLSGMRVSAYSAVAAAFAVVFLSLAVYSGIGRIPRTALLSPEENGMVTTGDVYSNLHGKDTTNGQPEGVVSWAGEADDVKTGQETGDSTVKPSSEFHAETPNDRQYQNSSDDFWLDDATRSAYRRIAGEALFSLEYRDTRFAYIGIHAFPQDRAEAYRSSLRDLTSGLSTQPVIEIFGGENSQKLVEYTGEDEALSLLRRAEQEDALLLVVSIGR